MALLYILFLALILLLTIIYINCHHMCMQNLIWNCHDTMKSRYQIWHTDMMRSISLLTKHHNIMFSADHYWSSYHLSLEGRSLLTACSVSNPHHYQNLGKAPNNVFCQFFRGHIFDDNIYVCTANFAANGTSQEDTLLSIVHPHFSVHPAPLSSSFPMPDKLFREVKLFAASISFFFVIWLIVWHQEQEGGWKYHEWGETTVQSAAARDCLGFQGVCVHTIWKMKQESEWLN